MCKLYPLALLEFFSYLFFSARHAQIHPSVLVSLTRSGGKHTTQYSALDPRNPLWFSGTSGNLRVSALLFLLHRLLVKPVPGPLLLLVRALTFHELQFSSVGRFSIRSNVFPGCSCRKCINKRSCDCCSSRRSCDRATTPLPLLYTQT